MKNILIDPFNKTVTEVDIDGDLQSIYDILQVDLICLGKQFSNGDVLYVDDEGLLKENQFFFMDSYPYAGRGLVQGEDDRNGEARSVMSTLEDIVRMTSFP